MKPGYIVAADGEAGGDIYYIGASKAAAQKNITLLQEIGEILDLVAETPLCAYTNIVDQLRYLMIFVQDGKQVRTCPTG